MMWGIIAALVIGAAVLASYVPDLKQKLRGAAYHQPDRVHGGAIWKWIGSR